MKTQKTESGGRGNRAEHLRRDRAFSAHNLGRSGEKIALRYLKRKKYKIIERGFRLHRGEIDIICFDKETLVFVEVKTRRSPYLIPPEASVTPSKQKQIRKIAEGFLQKRGLQDVECRFDVVSLTFKEDDNSSVLHIKNAF